MSFYYAYALKQGIQTEPLLIKQNPDHTGGKNLLPDTDQ
jgi:hypothetical protein